MRPKIRGIGTVALGIISGANAIYQLVFLQDIVLLIVSAMVSVLAFYIFVNRDNPDKKDQLQKFSHAGVVFFIGMVATIAFILIMNDFFGFEQWESWQKSVVRVTFVFGLVTVVNRYFKE
ncbi:MAG: hypothetical protein KHZ46_07160 [Granulicatella adiacens]|nr:hypothetical protein [Granulicatella adiacens]